MMIYVGIDPGLNGALAVINPARNEVQVWDTPTTTLTKPSGTKREYNEALLQTMFAGLRSRVVSPQQVHVALEYVHAMPGQGVRSMFSMGLGLGLWRGCIAIAGFPVTHVTPQQWKKSFGLIGADKNASRAKAMQLFPQVAPLLARVKDDGRADALLLAEFIQRLRAARA